MWCTTQEELEAVLQAKPDMQEQIVKVDLTFYRHTHHQTDMIAQPYLFKLNRISYEERLENFMILLIDADTVTGTLADLSANEYVLRCIKVLEKANPRNPRNQMCVCAWFVNEKYVVIAYIKDKINVDGYVADHMGRIKPE